MLMLAGKETDDGRWPMKRGGAVCGFKAKGGNIYTEQYQLIPCREVLSVLNI